MGFIYKVTNQINNKIYIGQTRRSITARWNDHVEASRTRCREENFPLHLAITKYGKENFLVEEIEFVQDNSLLDEREKYWISYYDSYNKGYNASLGGLGHAKYDYDDIVNFFLQNGNSLLATCQHFHIYDQVVYSALQSKNINYKELQSAKERAVYKGKVIHCIDLDLYFDKMSDIDKYFNKVMHPNVRRCLNGITKKAYGYEWEEIDINE